jgi:hypothetical protein
MIVDLIPLLLSYIPIIYGRGPRKTSVNLRQFETFRSKLKPLGRLASKVRLLWINVKVRLLIGLRFLPPWLEFAWNYRGNTL